MQKSYQLDRWIIWNYFLVFHYAFFIVAVAKHSFEKLDTQDAENKQKQEHDKQDVQKCRDGLNQRVHNCFDTFVFTYNPKWS